MVHKDFDFDFIVSVAVWEVFRQWKSLRSRKKTPLYYKRSYKLFKGAILGLFFCIVVFPIQMTVNKCSLKIHLWLDSNSRPLASEAAIALPTEPQLLARNICYQIIWLALLNFIFPLVQAITGFFFVFLYIFKRRTINIYLSILNLTHGFDLMTSGSRAYSHYHLARSRVLVKCLISAPCTSF